MKEMVTAIHFVAIYPACIKHSVWSQQLVLLWGLLTTGRAGSELLEDHSSNSGAGLLGKKDFLQEVMPKLSL